MFGVWEFAKTESIVTLQRRFRIMYHTEPPIDNTISEWYMKFQQSGCLCAAKRTGLPGTSAETIRACARNVCQESSEVNNSHEPGIADVSVKCLAHSAQTSSRKRIRVQLLQALNPQDHNLRLRFCLDFQPATGRRVCWEAGFQWWGDVTCVW